MAEKDDASIDSKKWYKNVFAIVSLVGALLAGVGGVLKFFTPLFEDKPVQVFPLNTEIVLDRTLAMGDPFAGTTKFDAAKTAVKKNLNSWITDDHNLSLRVFGGPCLEENTQMVVEFKQNNEGNIRKELDKISLNGEGSLYSAIGEALGDFSKKEFTGEGIKQKSLVIIAGNLDKCNSGLTFEQFMRKVNPDTSIKIEQMIGEDLRLIGLGLSEEERNLFKQISDELGGEEFFPENLDELIRAAGSPEQARQLKSAKDDYYTGKRLYDNNKYDEAIPSLKKAADQNIAFAMHYLGTIYFKGYQNNPPDYEKAAQWYMRGAKAGNPVAMFNLGGMYELSLWKTPKPDSAKFWYRRAADEGHENAKKRLQQLGG